MKLCLMLTACVFLGLRSLWAGTATTAASFLQENLNARLVGMAGSFSATAQGTEGILTNPAGVVRSPSPEVNASYESSQSQSHQTQLLYAHPFRLAGMKTSIGGALNYFTAGKIDVFDSNGTFTQSRKAEESYAAALCLSAELFPFLSLGVTPKYVSSKLLEQYSASGFATDIGVMAFLLPRHRDRLVLGAAVQNVGTKINYLNAENDLPRTMSLGISGIPWEDESAGSLLMTVQGEQTLGDKVKYRFGGEYGFGRKDARAFFLRGGTQVNTDEDFSLGVGFREKRISLDYAFVSAGNLDKTHRLTLVLKFGSPAWQEENEEPLLNTEQEGREPSRNILIEEDERRRKAKKFLRKKSKDELEYYLLEEEEKKSIK